MCIAIVKPEGTQLDDETLTECFKRNADGAGFAIVTPDGLHIEKGFMAIEPFLEAYKSFDVNAAHALVHFRITTRGSDDADNCHPFGLKHGALIHNGTIHNLGEWGKGKSDTQELAELIYDIPMDVLEQLSPLFGKFFGYNRIACMGHDGKTVVFNRKDWVEDSGILFSNSSYKPWVAPVGLVPYVGRGGYTPEWWDDEMTNLGRGYGYDGDEEKKEESIQTRIDAAETAEANQLPAFVEGNYDDFFWSHVGNTYGKSRLYRRAPEGFYTRDPAMEKAALDELVFYPSANDDDLDFITLELILEEEEQCQSMSQSTEPQTDTPSSSSPKTFEAIIALPSK